MRLDPPRALAELAVTVDELAEVPLDRLLACQDRISQELGLGAFVPYVDGVTLPKLPIEVIREGGASGIPLLVGSNRDEWNLFEVFLGPATVEPFKAPLFGSISNLFDRDPPVAPGGNGYPTNPVYFDTYGMT